MARLNDLKKVALELRRQTCCEHYHHRPSEYHATGQPCPVEARYDRVLGYDPATRKAR